VNDPMPERPRGTATEPDARTRARRCRFPEPDTASGGPLTSPSETATPRPRSSRAAVERGRRTVVVAESAALDQQPLAVSLMLQAGVQSSSYVMFAGERQSIWVPLLL